MRAHVTAGFDPKNPRTWPLNLSLDEVAAIYGRSREAIRHSLKPSAGRVAFTPAPYKRRPAQWRKLDVIRDLRANDPALKAVTA
jgi:hypothetical protein